MASISLKRGNKLTFPEMGGVGGVRAPGVKRTQIKIKPFKGIPKIGIKKIKVI